MKLRFLKSLASVMLVALVSNSWAIDLIDVYQAAEKNDPIFRAARAEYLSSKEATPQAIAVLLPQLQISGLLENQNAGANSSGQEFTITARQTVFDWGAFMKLREARAAVRAAAALFAAEEQDLIVRVVTAYFSVVAAQDIYKASLDLQNNAKINLDATRDRFKHGHATVTDIDQALASYDQAKANAWKTKIEEYTSLQQLSQLTAQSYKSVATLRFSFPLITPDPKSADHWVNKAKAGNLFLQSAEISVEVAKRSISVRRGDYIPALRAFGSYQPNGLNVNNVIVNQGINNFNYGLEVDYDAFEGGITLSEVRQAQADYQKAIADRERAYLSAVAQARSSYNAVVVGMVQLRAARRSVISSRNALTNTRKAYTAGVKTILDILTQQEVLFRAQREYAIDRESYLLNIALLEQSAGILSPVTLVGINQWLITNRKQIKIRDQYLSNLIKPIKMVANKNKVTIPGEHEHKLPKLRKGVNVIAKRAPKLPTKQVLLPAPKSVSGNQKATVMSHKKWTITKKKARSKRQLGALPASVVTVHKKT